MALAQHSRARCSHCVPSLHRTIHSHSPLPPLLLPLLLLLLLFLLPFLCCCCREGHEAPIMWQMRDWFKAHPNIVVSLSVHAFLYPDGNNPEHRAMQDQLQAVIMDFKTVIFTHGEVVDKAAFTVGGWCRCVAEPPTLCSSRIAVGLWRCCCCARRCSVAVTALRSLCNVSPLAPQPSLPQFLLSFHSVCLPVCLPAACAR